MRLTIMRINATNTKAQMRFLTNEPRNLCGNNHRN